MENPATWGEAERVIHDALAECERADAEGRVGASRPAKIARALREAGLLAEEGHPHDGEG